MLSKICHQPLTLPQRFKIARVYTVDISITEHTVAVLIGRLQHTALKPQRTHHLVLRIGFELVQLGITQAVTTQQAFQDPHKRSLYPFYLTL